MRYLIFGLLLSILFFKPGQAIGQANSTVPSIAGVWQGTSLCQVKDSPCHDETVVCHIAGTSNKNIFNVSMNKIVNGKEEEMGILEFTYEKDSKTLTCTREDRYKSVWKLKVNGNEIKGTLTADGVLFRIVDMVKKSG